MQITKKQITDVFIEWDRRERKNPEEFTTCAGHYLKDTPKTYGEGCANYFLTLLKEIKTKK